MFHKPLQSTAIICTTYFPDYLPIYLALPTYLRKYTVFQQSKGCYKITNVNRKMLLDM